MMLIIFMIQDKFGVRSIRKSPHEMMAALYLQVSIISQALIFVTRSRSWSFVERPGLLLVSAFMAAQLVRKIQPSIFFTLPTNTNIFNFKLLNFGSYIVRHNKNIGTQVFSHFEVLYQIG